MSASAMSLSRGSMRAMKTGACARQAGRAESERPRRRAGVAMATFDPGATLAMLQSLYPVPTGASLAQAMIEQPQYFAGAVQIGRFGDAIRLPDGAVWDLIFDVGGPSARWQAIVPGPSGASGDAAYPLEPGPFDGLAPFTLPDPRADHTFEQLLGGALLEMGDVGGVADRAELLMMEGASPRRPRMRSGSARRRRERARRQRSHARRAAAEELLEASDDQSPALDAADSESATPTRTRRASSATTTR
jgi:hypothetical protein